VVAARAGAGVIDAAPSAERAARDALRVLGTPRVRAALWLALAVPALYQVALLLVAIHGRLTYPYDLEWMEGGMLQHALRLRQGQPLYAAPSVDFIPYLYTPLYPALLAAVGSVVGISYAVGRAISALALLTLAVVAVAAVWTSPRPQRGAALAGAVLALGLFAAAYPIVDGWFDLVRADSLLLAMVTVPLALLPRWARSGASLGGHARVAAAGALLALAFFCKQTGVLYVALGGGVVLVLAWRRLPAYVAAAGAVGLGGVAIMQHVTGGWFWIYISKIHRAHDFNWHRFWWSFGNILWQPWVPGQRFPALGAAITPVVMLGLAAVLASWWRHRQVPRAAQPLLLWAAAYAVSTVVGALGWATEFAHFNAYMPAFLHGALAAGAALPAIHACVRGATHGTSDGTTASTSDAASDATGQPHAIAPRAELRASAAALLVAVPLAAACALARWSPQRFIPSSQDRAAAARLIERLRHLDGEVWMPSHPWYLVLAGKRPFVHRMGIKDVTTRQSRVVERLDDELRHRRFAALVLDQRDVHLELPLVTQCYRLARQLPADERPKLYSGARVEPDSIWVPIPATP
jgi:hypothetical protein